MKTKLKRILSVLLITAQVMTCFTGCGIGDGSFFDIFKKKLTVSFALPDDASLFDKEETYLPEPVKVKKGTLVASMPESNRTSSIFMGYSYDPEGLKSAGESDSIEEDLTLYPQFKISEGMTNVFDMNFVSGQDVSSDYTIELSAYGLTEAEVRELITLKDLSLGEEEVPYLIEENGATLPADVNISERVMPYVKNLIESNLEDNTVNLSEGLDALGLDSDTIYRLVLIYAPEERVTFLNEIAKKTGDEPLTGFAESEIIGIGNKTENELKALYGIEEGESLEKYWREELGYELEDVLRLSDVVKANSVFAETSRFIVKPSEEGWAEGDLFQIEILNTERLRFVFGDEICTKYITYYNFTTHCEEKKNLSVDSKVVFIPSAEVSGVTLGSMFEVSVDKDGNQTATERYISGVLTYKGTEAIDKGSTIAVYDGTLNDDGSVDGEVGYFEITENQGEGKYAYRSADLKNVLALPEIVPVKAERIVEEMTALIPKSDLKFDKRFRDILGFDEVAEVDPGDYLAFYEGDISKVKDLDSPEGIEFKGYAKVLSVSEENGKLKVTFENASAEDVVSSVNLYMKTGEVAPELAEIDEEAIKQSMLDEIERSNLVNEASDYLCDALLTDEADLSNYKNRDKLAAMKFKTGDGDELTFDEVRKLADGGKKVEVGDVNVSFVVSGALQHFEGKAGLRAEVTVSLKITVSLGEAGNIEITPMIVFEQEVLISPAINVKGKWGYLLGFIPYLAYIDIDPTFECGTYTGFGLNVTIMTTEKDDEDGEFADMVKEYNDNAGDGKYKREDTVKNLIKSGDSLKKLADLKKGAESGAGGQWEGGKKKENEDGPLMENQSPGVGGSLPDKYSAMLGNDAAYIDLVNKEIGTFATPVDPFHLVEFSIGAYFVVSFKLNAMIGTGVSYENAKQFTYHVRKYVCARGEDEKESSQADLATPHFRADFYAFGMIGIRVGIRIDVRLGIISTKLASIGVTAEIGLYAEVYGFLYVWYEWTSGQGSTSGAMGSVYFEVGIYLEINFVAQLGDGKYSKEISLYENTWPLVKLGAESVPLDFTIERYSDDLDIEYPEGKNYVSLPEDLYKINMMDMKSGEVSEENVDSQESCGEGTSFTMRGRTYTQYDEENFYIECYDTDEDGNKLDTCSFIYVPATNEVLVKPANTLTNEVWGEVKFTYKNTSFGFNTMKMSRTVSLHWEGTPAAATVEYYVETKPGSGEYELKEEGEFDGFNGIEYDIIVDDDFTYKYDGYRLSNVVFEDTAILKEKYYSLLEEYNEMASAYLRNGNNADVVESMRLRLDAAFKNLNTYGQNLLDTIKNGKGTLYFLMGEKETVVKVYYDHIVNDVTWRVFGDPNMAGEMGTILGHGKVENVAEGESINEKLEDARKILSKYEDAVELDKIEIAEDVEDAEFKAFDEKALMEDKPIVVDFYVKAKTYNLTWVFDEEKVATQEVGAYYRTELTPPEIDVTEGYYLLYWDTSDMSKDLGLNIYIPDILTKGYKYVMPARDAVITAKLQPKKYKIEWYSGDRILARDYFAEYGSVISKSPWFPHNSNDHQIEHWSLETANGLVDLEESMTMPASDIKLFVEYEFIPYTATFMDGNRVVAKIDEDEDFFVKTPAYTDETRKAQGYDLKWLFHAPAYSGLSDSEYAPGDKVRMPNADVTFTAVWTCATHRWDGGVVTSNPTCSSGGSRLYTCLNCGETRTESIPATGVHTYGAVTYTWGQDHVACNAKKVCTGCQREVTETTTAITAEIIVEPTATSTGIKRYTATFSGANGFGTCVDDVEIVLDRGLYYNAFYTEHAPVSGDTITITIPDEYVWDDGELADGLLSDLTISVYDGSGYYVAYRYVSSDLDSLKYGQVQMNTVYNITLSQDVDPNFTGIISEYPAPPTKVILTRQ